MPTPEERRKYIEGLRGTTPTRTPTTPTPTPSLGVSRRGREARAASKLTGAEVGAERAEDALRRELFAKFQAEMGPATTEAVLARVDEEMASRTQPAFVGGFVSPVVPYVEGLPSKVPEEAPMPVGQELTFGEVLRPKVRVPSVAKENPFNDVEFEKSLKGVSETERQEHRSTYKGFKSAYAKLRELNPSSSTEELVADIERQLKELPTVLGGGGAVITQDPRLELGIANDPVALALSKQTGAGVVPKLEPGQLAFMKGIYESELPLQVSKDRDTLKREGRQVTRKELRPTGEVVGGRPVREEVEVPTGQVVPYTPQEIDAIVARRQAEGKYDARPWWANEAERQRVLADPEKYAKGGLLFEKKYATGATVESPVAWTVRAAMSPINAAAGLIGYGFTPEDIQRQKAAGRPEKYKGEGVAENVLYNVAAGGGFTQEIGDLYKYHPDPTVRRYETAGRAAGFAADLLSLGDIAVAAGVGGGIKAGVQTARAARLAGEAAPLAAGLRAGVKGAVAGYVDALPGLGRLAEKLQPGDVRLVYGGKLADDFKAASAYKHEYDKAYNELVDVAHMGDEAWEASGRMTAHEDALRAIEQQYAGTKFFDDAVETGMSIRKSIDGDYFTAAQRAFNASDDVARLADDLALGRRALTTAEELRLKPYLAAAAKADPEITRAIADAFQGAAPNTRVTASTVFDALPDAAAKAYYADAIKTGAAFEAGVKTLDTQLAGAYQKGAPTVMLTPRTLATPESAKVITDRYLESNFYNNVVLPLQDLPRVDVESAGKVTRGFNLADLADPDTVARLRQSVNEARLVGNIPEQDASRMLSNIERGVMSADDLRALTYAEVDDIALGGRAGFTARAVAERKGLPKGVAQARRMEELAGTRSPFRRAFTDAMEKTLPVSIRKAAKGLTEWASPLEDLISPVQRQIITDAKGKVGALNKTLQDEFKRIGSDPEFARMYGVTTDAPVDEKMIALGRGAMKGGNPVVGKTYAEELLNSIFYGTKRSPLYAAVMGDYKYGRVVLSNVPEYERMVEEVANLTPSQLASRLEGVFDDARRLVDANINPALTDAGGRALSVPSKLAPEALSVAYARTRTGEIVADAAVKVIPERPVGMSEPGRKAVLALNQAGMSDDGGSRFFYELVKGEIANPGFLDDMVERSGGVSFGELRGYLLELVARTNPDLDAARGSRFVYDWLLETNANTGRLNLYEISADVQDQVDLMRSGGLLHNTDVDTAIARVGDLVAGRISPNQLVLPALADKMLADIGTEPKYEAMLRELARLSDEAEDGSLSAARAVRFVRDAMDSYSAFFYYNTLSLAPRFHGVNNLTAPLIIYFTTGRPSNVLNAGEAANVLLLGSPLSKNPAARFVPVVTDRFGTVYTRGDLYDLAVKNGMFKSQVNTEVAGSFIEDANRIVGNLSTFQKGRKAVFTAPREFLGDPLAAFTDNVWRMETVTAALRDGKTLDEALDLGRRSLYDYGNLTEAERVVSRNVFVFYNYFRQSIVQFVKNAVDNPSRIIRMVRATEQPSKIMVGDQNARDLSFYFPPEFGVGRIVAKLEPAVGKKEGMSVALPMMPHADALNIAGMALTDPVGWMLGPTPEGRDRAFTEGFVAKRLGPLTKVAGAMLFSDAPVNDLLEVKLTKNRIPPEHMAFYQAALPDAAVASLYDTFGITEQDAVAGEENALNGKTYRTTDSGFENYKLFINALQTTGMNRTLTDYGKMMGGLDLTGAYPKTTWGQLSSATGAATFTGAVADEVLRRKAIEARTGVLTKESATMKRERLPERESDKR